MDEFFEKYGWICVEALVGLFAIVMMMGIFKNTTIVTSDPIQGQHQTVVGAKTEYTHPVVEDEHFVVHNDIFSIGDTFNWKNYVTVHTDTGIDLIDYVTVKGTPDTSKFGQFTMTYTLNFNGKRIVKKATYYVRE